MKYALDGIESLIQSDLTPENFKHYSPIPELLSGYIAKINAENEHIHNFFVKKIGSLTKEIEMELLVHRYQSKLIKLSDQVTGYISTVKNSNSNNAKKLLSISKVYEHIIKCIEELLTYIETNFSRYCNKEENISLNHKALTQIKFTEWINLLTNKYTAAGVNENIYELMFYPFNKIISDVPVKKITYGQLIYLDILYKKYTAFNISGQKPEVENNIFRLLIYLNFNNIKFFNHYAKHILDEVALKNSFPAKMEHLSWWLKTVNQLQTHPVLAHKLKVESAKYQLIRWLQEEIIFFEKKQSLNLTPSTSDSMPKKTIPVLTTTLSVKELALLFRVMNDIGILENESHAEVINKVVGIFKTTRKDEISPGSLRKNFYTLEEHTKNILKDHLKSMINQINNY
jgi:hypothetical protein